MSEQESPGKKLIRLGAALGLAVRELAPLLQVSESALRNYARRSGSHNPSARTISRMIQVAADRGMDVPPSWFHDPDAPMPERRRATTVRESAVPYGGADAPTQNEVIEDSVGSIMTLVDAFDALSRYDCDDKATEQELGQVLDWIGSARESLDDAAHSARSIPGQAIIAASLAGASRRLGVVASVLARKWSLGPAT